MLKRTLLVSLALVPVLYGQTIRVAVLAFRDYSGEFGEFTEGLPDLLSTKIAATGDAMVIERAQIDMVLQEQGLSRTKEFDPETAVRVGKLLGVEAVVLGGVYTSGDELEIAARVVTTQTGEVRSGYSVRGSRTGSHFDLIDELAQKVTLAWSAILRVRSNPTDASVLINGEPRGSTPVSLAGMKSGSYTIRVTRSGYDDWTQTVSLSRGDDRTVTAQMKEEYRAPQPAPQPKEKWYDNCFVQVLLSIPVWVLVIYLISAAAS